MRPLLLALALPPMLATAAVLVPAVSRPPEPRNLAEAAAMGNAPAVMRLLRAGADPSREWPVGPRVISSAITHVTAVEAAVWSRQGPMVDLIEREGGIRDDATRAHLACLAADLRADEVVQVLTRHGAPACVAGETLAAVAARSRTP